MDEAGGVEISCHVRWCGPTLPHHVAAHHDALHHDQLEQYPGQDGGVEVEAVRVPPVRLPVHAPLGHPPVQVVQVCVPRLPTGPPHTISTPLSALNLSTWSQVYVTATAA